MQNNQTIIQASQVHSDQNIGALHQLGLTEKELMALKYQGYIQRDRWRIGKPAYARLRFRMQGRLRTIYLGTDSVLVAEVQQDLAAWQAAHDSSRNLDRVVAKGKRALRRAKSQSEVILAELGYHFHGDTIRQFRGSPS